MFWGENRPEWIVCYWGCIISGVVVVPIDYRSSPDFLARGKLDEGLWRVGPPGCIAGCCLQGDRYHTLVLSVQQQRYALDFDLLRYSGIIARR